MKLTAKLLAVLLTALLVIATIPFAFAAISYDVNPATGVLTISGEGDMESYQLQSAPAWREQADVITSIVIESGVTSIGAYAFKDLKNVVSVTVPETVTLVDQYAFQDCKKLQYITLPEGITEIRTATFYGCEALTTIEIPETVEIIKSYAFTGTGLTEIFLPMAVKKVESYAFSNCSALKKITIKNKTLEIGKNAFPPATPKDSAEEPVTFYAVYGSRGYNHAVANEYAYVTIPDEDKPDTGTPETVKDVISKSEQELKDTKIGGFFYRLMVLLGLRKDEIATSASGSSYSSGTGSDDTILVVTGPGKELANLLLKTSLGDFILGLREIFQSLTSGLDLQSLM